MNPGMFLNPATQRNLKQIKEDGYRIIEPQEGEVVCSESGPGKLAAIEAVLEAIESIFNRANAWQYDFLSEILYDFSKLYKAATDIDLKPLIVQSDKTLLLEVDHPAFEEARAV